MRSSFASVRLALSSALLVAVGAVTSTSAQQTTQPRRPGADERTRPARRPVKINQARAESLYVSTDPADHPPRNFERDIATKARTDSIYAARSRGAMEFSKVKYRSRAGDMDVPAYLFTPLAKRGARGHAAMVWVHGGVHGDWNQAMLPFVKEAVQRGYVIITPDYRGSNGYGAAHYNAIDYGGKELDDVMAAYDYLKTLPYVDPERVGIMGWSHGGFITSHLVMREETPFKAGAAIVPVTNLVFRLSDHGPNYARDYAAEEGFHGLPFERSCGPKKDRDCIDIYMERSPVFHVDNLKVPMLVHVATNDCDVFFRENQQMVYTLRALKPNLAETKIYKDPPPGPAGCGHTFSRRVNMQTLEREDTPEQIDSWNLTWAFFQRNLKP